MSALEAPPPPQEARPPRSLEWAAELLLRGERGQVVLGDLAETYAELRAKGAGRRSSHLWYIRQLAASLVSVAFGPRPRQRPYRSPGDSPMQGFIDDLRFLVRSLMRRPGFTVPVVLTLALGVGIGTTVFSVVKATLLSVPGFDEPERLVMIWNRQQQSAESSNLLSGADYHDLRERSSTLSDVAGVFEVVVAPVTGEGGEKFARMGTSTPNLFELLGVHPVLGRLFEEADGAPLPDGVTVGPPGVTVLSHDYWWREHGGDPDILGRRFFSFTREYVVIGVLPPGFQLVFPQEALMGEDLGSAIDFWTVPRTDYSRWNRGSRGTRTIARLAVGRDLADARGELDNIASTLRAEHSIHQENGLRLGAERLLQQSSRHLRPLLGLLSGAVLGVLLVACINAAGLMLTRLMSRHRELEIRTAMGASSTSLGRLVLTEGLLLGGLGAVLGIALSLGGMQLLQWLRPAGLPQASSLRLDLGVLVFALLLALLSALAAGLYPTLRILRRSRHELGGERHTQTRHHRHLLEAMVAVQIALTVLLLIGTGLMVRTFVKLQQVPLGFDPHDVLTVDISTVGPQPDRSQEDWFEDWIARRRGYERTLGERLAELPGVETAGAVFPVPLNGVYSRTCSFSLAAEGRTEVSGTAYFRNVWPGYFDTVDMPLLGGRDFTFDDDQAGLGEWASLDDGPRADQPRVVIDERLADRLWPGESAVGRRLTFAIYADIPHHAEVIGVVPFVPQTGLLDPLETIYIPRSYYRSQELTLLVRPTRDTPSVREAIASEVRNVFVESPVSFRPLDDYVDRALAPTRFALTLLGVFAATGLVLASIGLYGTLALMVRRRRREIGVQMAMGAAPGRIGRSVALRAASLCLIGIASGALIALLVSRFLSGHLFEIAPTDPVTFVSAAGFQLLVALIAAWLPARRAAAVDPTVALRGD